MIQAGNDDASRLPASLMSDWGRRTPMVFAAFVVVATLIAGFAAPGAGLAILVLGLITLIAVDFGAWLEGEAKDAGPGRPPAWDELAASTLERLALGPRARPVRPSAAPIEPTDLNPVTFAAAVPPPSAEPPSPAEPRCRSRVRIGRPMPQ
jgi:hypothetical protein